ncbi:dihydroxyacetone phosphate acyltransferase [Parasteatoda tepidariorum]|uniref:dihydroxyacetone phosphate acyltransferase n=1 Tax=Parasteatoda tepidariorum TaxID=114398 RepID=UPI00077F8EF0|nr:dihydroxyacetone phosphate acyltransferase [Parasteatoda tepidariorum]
MNNDSFVDILSDRRHKTTDIGWALKPWNVSGCRYSLKRTPQEIKQYVLSCDRLKNVISEISKDGEYTEKELEEKAEEILDEMSHNFQFRIIRFFGFVLSKFMKSVYGKILVDKQGINKLSSVSSQYPVIYLPTHRSYSDFLLVSYICFYFNLPVPVIAAGLDFLGLKYLSFLLRGAGAFFIRRSFVGDRLYREIFTSYVQTHIEGAEFPLEFFIEGTRSRTAKSLVPKLGMLQTILELYFSSKVPDITIVPISITYDRTLEENLYAYELLGVPKPKESTKGLIKARKVMSDYFGNVYVKFGDPLSLREHFSLYDRSIHNLHPRSLSVPVKKEQTLCGDLANVIIRSHQSNLIISPFPIICLVIGQPEVTKYGGILFDTLLDYTLWMQDLLKRSGTYIHTGEKSLYHSVSEQLELHSNILQVTNSFISLKEGVVQCPSPTSSISRLTDASIRSAIPAMFAYHYGNQALQLLVNICMVCLAVMCDEQNVHLKGDVFLKYEILRKLLRREFVFSRMSSEEDFLNALDSLEKENIISIEALKLIPVESNVHKIQFLSSLIVHFLQTYHVVTQHLFQIENKINSDLKKLSLECQSEIENAIIHGSLTDYRCLSLDIVNNCITFLINEGALSKISENNKVIMASCHSTIANILMDLDVFVPPHKKQFSINDRLSLPTAKL